MIGLCRCVWLIDVEYSFYLVLLRLLGPPLVHVYRICAPELGLFRCGTKSVLYQCGWVKVVVCARCLVGEAELSATRIGAALDIRSKLKLLHLGLMTAAHSAIAIL